jgi:uncharacterized phage-like protein YoqJ
MIESGLILDAPYTILYYFIKRHETYCISERMNQNVKKATGGKAAFIIGHRDIPASRKAYIMNELRREIGEAVAVGYEHFISDFSEGTGLLAASVVLELKRDWQSMTLEAAIAEQSRLDQLRENGETDAMLRECVDVGVHGGDYPLEKSGRVIAVYDGREDGGTARAIHLARSLDRELRAIGY